MSDYDSLNAKGEITSLIASLKATVAYSEDETDKKVVKMRELLIKAYATIEAQQEKIRTLEGNTIPSKDEVESMSAMLDILNKLDIKTLDKLTELGNKENK